MSYFKRGDIVEFVGRTDNAPEFRRTVGSIGILIDTTKPNHDVWKVNWIFCANRDEIAHYRVDHPECDNYLAEVNFKKLGHCELEGGGDAV